MKMATRCLVSSAIATAALVVAEDAAAQPISKAGFNYNVPACPTAGQYASLATINVDRFSDGSPLPSCGGIQGNVRFKMVWTGKAWAKYGPSIQVVTPVTVPQPQPLPSPRPPPAPTPAPRPSPVPAPAPRPTPPPPPNDPAIVGAITDAPLPSVSELQSTVGLGLQYTQNLRGLYRSMEAYTSGPDALFDQATVREAEAGLDYIQYLLSGPNNPYSLQKLATGGPVALNNHERQLLASLLADDPDVARLRKASLDLDRALAMAGSGSGGAVGPDAPRILRALDWRPSIEQHDASTSPLWRSVLFNDELNLPPIHNFDQPVGLTGLDRATALAVTLAYGQRLNTTSTFLTYSTQVESQLSAFVDRLAAQVYQGGKVNIGEISRVMKAYAAIKLTVQLTNAAVNAVAAITPSSISNVFMNLGGRPYVRNAPPWPLKVNETVNAQIYVVPHAPGGSLVTPLGAVNLVIDAGLGPKVSGVFSKVMGNREAAKQIQDAFVAVVKKLGKIHADAAASYLSNYHLSSWASAVQNSISIPARDLTPLEINDTRLVHLTPGAHIDISQDANHRFIIKGVDAGTTSITGTLTNRVPALTTGAGATSFRIAIQVDTAQPPPSVYHPCGKPGDGGILVNGKCVYPD